LPQADSFTPGDDDAGTSPDEADDLPAVGRVWDTGPKRSLGEILAEANLKKRQSPATIQPSQRPSHVSADLASIWPATLQEVQDSLGASVHVPMLGGKPRREGESVIVHFGGAFAVMARYLEKYRERMQQILCTVAGEPMLLQFEIDESSPVTPASALESQGQQHPLPRQERGTSTAPPAAQGRDGVPLTPELRTELEKDPLIRAFMEAFNGNIVKVEQ